MASLQLHYAFSPFTSSDLKNRTSTSTSLHSSSSSSSSSLSFSSAKLQVMHSFFSSSPARNFTAPPTLKSLILNLAKIQFKSQFSGLSSQFPSKMIVLQKNPASSSLAMDTMQRNGLQCFPFCQICLMKENSRCIFFCID